MIGAKCNLKDRFAKRLLTLEGEQLICSTRQHWFTLLPSLSANLLFVIFVLVFTSIFYILTPTYFLTYLLLALIFLIVIAEIFIKELVEWYFHFYVVTNRKILEVTNKPLSLKAINEVLLDQVRCTEVDVEMRGVLSEALNIGNVVLTFDRPTHEETFTLKRIKGPRKIAMHIGDSFETKYEKGIWSKDNSSKKNSYRFIEELNPNTNYQLGGL